MFLVQLKFSTFLVFVHCSFLKNNFFEQLGRPVNTITEITTTTKPDHSNKNCSEQVLKELPFTLNTFNVSCIVGILRGMCSLVFQDFMMFLVYVTSPIRATV